MNQWVNLNSHHYFCLSSGNVVVVDPNNGSIRVNGQHAATVPVSYAKDLIAKLDEACRLGLRETVYVNGPVTVDVVNKHVDVRLAEPLKVSH